MMRIWNDLLYLFFPRLCLLCRRPLVEGEEHICLHCAEDLPYTYYIDVHGNPVYRLFKERFPVEAVTAFLFFKQGGSAQTLIHALKYDGNRQLGYHLGRMAALEYRESGLFDAVDCLLPVGRSYLNRFLNSFLRLNRKVIKVHIFISFSYLFQTILRLAISKVSDAAIRTIAPIATSPTVALLQPLPFFPPLAADTKISRETIAVWPDASFAV